MNKSVDCRIFADQLDALVRGRLPDEGMRQLRIHAESCAECGLQLKVQEHLLEPSLETLQSLEARVPEEMVTGMWKAVREDLTSRRAAAAERGGPDEEAGVGADGSRGDGSGVPGGRVLFHPRFRDRLPWLVPALAAATVALLFSTGFLLWQTERLGTRAAALAAQVEDQRHWMAQLEADASDPVARTAALAGRSAWSRALARQEEISLGGLRDLLARAPGDRVILTRSQVDAVLRSRIPLSPPILREALAGISGGDDVTAEELLQALDGLDVSPDTTLPTAELVALLS